MIKISEMKRVLYLNPFNSAISGPDESLIRLIGSFPKKDFSFHLALPKDSPYLEQYQQLNCKIIKINLDRLKRTTNPLYLLLNLFRLTWGTIILYRYIKRENIDLVHTNMEVTLAGGLAAKISGKKSIIHYRGNADKKRSLFFTIYYHLLNIAADKVIAISNAVANVFKGHPLAKKVIVLYDSYNPQDFSQAIKVDLRTELGLGKNAKLVATATRIHPRKRIDLLLKTAHLVCAKEKNCYFLLAGDATSKEEEEYKKKMLSLAEQLKIKKNFIITGVRNDIPSFFKSVNLFFLCSEREGFGMVALEAQAAGLAVIAAGDGGMAEIVEDRKSGLLISGHREEPFAKAILSLLTNEERAEKMGEAGEERAKTLFSSEIIAAQLNKIYDELLSKNGEDNENFRN